MLLPTIVTSKERGKFEIEHMRYKHTNSSNAKLNKQQILYRCCKNRFAPRKSLLYKGL